jgi:hypothetical protein
MKYRKLKEFLDGLTDEQLDQDVTLLYVDHDTTTNVFPEVLTDDLINPDGEGLEPREAYNDPSNEDYMEYYHHASAIYPKGTVCIYATSDFHGTEEE